MTAEKKQEKPEITPLIRPWYREPWPWVAIAIPAAAMIMGAITFYLAVSNPDYLVVDEDQYRDIESELGAQTPPEAGPTGQEASREQDDGEH
jgi:hypothetical protein